jgi:hypothetical protein
MQVESLLKKSSAFNVLPSGVCDVSAARETTMKRE